MRPLGGERIDERRAAVGGDGLAAEEGIAEQAGESDGAEAGGSNPMTLATTSLTTDPVWPWSLPFLGAPGGGAHGR